MIHGRRLLAALTLSSLMLLSAAAEANSAPTLEADLQEQGLLTADAPHLIEDLQTLRVLGVQRIRVGVAWDRIAPGANSRRRPQRFDGADPTAYPAANWLPYDTLVTEAARYGLAVNFDVEGGAPLWAVGRARTAALARVWYPSASEFGAFVQAIGRRYSGRYAPPGSVRLPRVSSWSLWNQPNGGAGSLAPQVNKGVEIAPSLYRALADAAYHSLVRTGHGRDSILVGELAATGKTNPGAGLGMQPLRFLRALFCVGADYRPLVGQPAVQRGCPSTARASRRFRATNPALFRATGWSHHPYSVDGTAPPDVPSGPRNPDSVTLADLPKFERVLDRLQRAYGSSKRYSIYLTQYGYDTRPPQRTRAISPSAQAAYLNQAEYMAWHDRRVVTLAQGSLQDTSGAGAEGLIFASGQPKPSFDAYRLPLVIPATTAARGAPLELWGCIRPSHFAVPDTGRAQNAQIQFQPGSSGAFLWLGNATVSTATSCYFNVRMQLPESGTVRLAFRYPANDPSLPAGQIVYSRRIRITLQ
jgi:hypothetical protein